MSITRPTSCRHGDDGSCRSCHSGSRQDAEIAADIGEDGADRPAADFGRDLLRRGQVGENGGSAAADGRGGWACGGAMRA